MKRMIYFLALCATMSVYARMYDIRKYKLEQTITRWVEQSKKDKTFDELPQIIKDTWAQIEKKEYDVSRNNLVKISQALSKHSLKSW